jgi:dissimilatory sulfite reductase (desulfoviridin) alpha/beta subunit
MKLHLFFAQGRREIFLKPVFSPRLCVPAGNKKIHTDGDTMKWTLEAEAAIKKVPFFVRKRVRSRVESEAAAAGGKMVGIKDVRSTQKRYLSGMASEIKGYQLDACFGPSGCKNRIGNADTLVKHLEKTLKHAGILEFLTKTAGPTLKFHHEFRVSLAECPNACSQPQIKDVGVIAACEPKVTDAECTLCEACKEACPDDAVTIDTEAEKPIVAPDLCMACGNCITACPSGTLAEGLRGYKVLLGGKLGRHPRLAKQLPGIHDENEVLAIVRTCIDYYKDNSRRGQRFSELLDRAGFEDLIKRLGL